MSQQPQSAGKTLVIKFAGAESRQTLMIPIDADGNALTHLARRMDGLPLVATQVNDEILVDGKPLRVTAVAVTFRMPLAPDWEE
jgi:hypothetical protein